MIGYVSNKVTISDKSVPLICFLELSHFTTGNVSLDIMAPVEVLCLYWIERKTTNELIRCMYLQMYPPTKVNDILV